MSLFDIIAPIYGLFFNFQLKYFERIQNKVSYELDISQYNSVLDIGCGTGALCKTLYDRGLDVTGVDPSIGMIKQAKKKLKDTPVNFSTIKVGDELPFEDKSFDVVITTYVAHGLKSEERIELYEEMKRIAREIVIIHDYNKKRAILTTIVEWLERGDYFNFIKVAKEEMNEVFGKVREINVDTRASWYICYCSEK
ncbi:MAG TPA: class I SAM-dependent methyltransferase [Tissierellaceae bacterium]|nr:class I SAM-dependent methyltransferase [Tissierellaceae bacterium]